MFFPLSKAPLTKPNKLEFSEWRRQPGVGASEPLGTCRSWIRNPGGEWQEQRSLEFKRSIDAAGPTEKRSSEPEGDDFINK